MLTVNDRDRGISCETSGYTNWVIHGNSAILSREKIVLTIIFIAFLALVRLLKIVVTNPMTSSDIWDRFLFRFDLISMAS